VPVDRANLERVLEAKARVTREPEPPHNDRRPRVPRRNQPTAKPTTKVATGGAAGAVTVLAVWGASLAGVDVPPEAASAFTTVVTLAAAYLVPSSYGKG
jgi:hypothetical protein